MHKDICSKLGDKMEGFIHHKEHESTDPKGNPIYLLAAEEDELATIEDELHASRANPYPEQDMQSTTSVDTQQSGVSPNHELDCDDNDSANQGQKSSPSSGPQQYLQFLRRTP